MLVVWEEKTVLSSNSAGDKCGLPALSVQRGYWVWCYFRVARICSISLRRCSTTCENDMATRGTFRK